MITTVSVSTVSTVTSMAAMGLTAALSMGAGVLLLILLVTKQLALAKGSAFSARLGRFSTIGIAPFLISFGVITAIQFFQLMP